MADRKRIRVTVVGDGDTGKTCMLIVYKDNKYDDTYIPTVFDSYSMTIPIYGEDYQIILSDTAGQEEYDKLRPLVYPDTDIFVVCYAVNNRTSFKNIVHKWIPELRHYKPNSKIILVGTKLDLRTTGHKKFISESEGNELKQKIQAHTFLECSSKLNFNIGKVIEAALTAFVNNPHRPTKPKCDLL